MTLLLLVLSGWIQGQAETPGPQPPPSSAQKGPELRAAPLLLEERLAIAHRGREEAQKRYTQGLCSTTELLRWDRRLVTAYLDTCQRAEDHVKGWEYLIDRATAVRDFEKRRKESQADRSGGELLEADYTLAYARWRLLEFQKGAPQQLAEARKNLLEVCRQGYAERLAAMRQGACSISEPLVWSKRWLNAEWDPNGPISAHRLAARAHFGRIGEVESAWKALPPPGKKPAIDPAEELACRRAEIAPYLAEDPRQVKPLMADYADRMRRMRDVVLAASRDDRLAIEPALDWLDRWFDAELVVAGSPPEVDRLFTHAVLLHRELELDARRRLDEGSRFVGEADLLAVAYARLGVEIRLSQAQAKTTPAARRLEP